MPKLNPCQSMQCGPHSQCREINSQAVCSCLPNYIGTPPNCRPECTVNSDCFTRYSCKNNRCVDPCLSNQCGLNARCSVINHNVICACQNGYTGDPLQSCILIKPGKFYFLIYLHGKICF